MKNTTKALSGERFGIKLFFPHETRYYYAVHRNGKSKFLWLETKKLGQAVCYPYALIHGDETLLFKKSTQPGADDNNRRLTERWNELITPRNLKVDFKFQRLDEDEFVELCSMLLNG